MPEIDMMFTLTDDELDAVAGGQTASASIILGTITASGPTSATVSATGLSATTAVVGGLAPSATASVAGTITSASA